MCKNGPISVIFRTFGNLKKSTLVAYVQRTPPIPENVLRTFQIIQIFDCERGFPSFVLSREFGYLARGVPTSSTERKTPFSTSTLDVGALEPPLDGRPISLLNPVQTRCPESTSRYLATSNSTAPATPSEGILQKKKCSGATLDRTRIILDPFENIPRRTFFTEHEDMPSSKQKKWCGAWRPDRGI